MRDIKKLAVFLIVVLLTASLAACGNAGSGADTSDSGTSAAARLESGNEIVDLTKLSSTMAYSQLFHITQNSVDYLGRSICLSGECVSFKDPVSENLYYACVVTDQEACCSAGLEFVMDGEPVAPDGYPEPGAEITVTGELQYYRVGESTFLHLVNAVVE